MRCRSNRSSAFAPIIEAIDMQNTHDRWSKYYGADTRAKIEAQSRSWTPELQAQAEKQWADLFRDVEAILGEDPAGAEAQGLADRWTALLERFTKGDPAIEQGVKAFYQDSANWPAEVEAHMTPFRNPQVWAFMSRALAVRRSN